MVANHVTLDQRFRRAGDCPICEGGDSMKRGQGARCYGFEMARGNAVVCTQIASPHPSGNGYVHVVDKPCDCGDDHSAGYRGDFIPRASKPATPAKITQAHKSQTPDAIHDYGAARLLRYGSGKEKRLCWQHFDCDRGWIDGLGGVTPGFYRAEAVRNADTRKPVYLAEGEKAVDALAAAGAVAGCNPGGAGKWREEYGAILSGRHVVILADADETGRTHAQLVAQSLAGVAASVRMIELEGAHDVADWLADGHTLLELLEITACTLPAQYSNPATQDASSGESQKTPCQHCERERELRQIAEASLTNLRRDVARLDRVMAIDNEKVSAPTKVITYAAVRELSKARQRNGNGMIQTYRAALAKRAGVKEQAAGSQLIKASKAGLVARDMQRTFDDATLYIGEGPILDHPQPAENIPTPERAHGWGGKRVKGCPHCGSSRIVATVYACEECGSVLKPDELIDVVVAEETQDDAQDTPPPLDTIVTHLASDAQDDAGDALRCPACGRGGDMLKDYGDGLRCRACDALAERREL